MKALSPREMEVVRHTWDGLTQPEVASRMGISVKGVEYHSARLRNKLRVKNTVLALRRAVELGLLPIKKGGVA